MDRTNAERQRRYIERLKARAGTAETVDTSALTARITELEAEVARLKADARQRASQPKPKAPKAPSEREFERRVEAEVRRRFAERDTTARDAVYEQNQSLQKQLTAVRKGFLTDRQYRVIRGALHTDRVDDPAQKKLYAEIFQLVGDHRLVIVKPEEAPIPDGGIPRDLADWAKARAQTSAQRAAKRKR